MALVPEYFNLLNALGAWEEDDWDIYRPSRMVIRYPSLHQHLQQRPSALRNLYRIPRDTGISGVVNDKDNFKVNLDVQQFKPEEISVKVADKHVLIEGKHEERADDHGFISRQFQRRYLLPADVDPNAVVSQLSSDGVLTIQAPKKAALDQQRSIPITYTNQPAVKPAEEKKSGEAEKMQQ